MIQWLNAVIDIPAPHFGVARDFWTTVTKSRTGDIHPDHDEFVHMLPQSGDMHLELQRIEEGPAGVHLDLVVDDIPALTKRAMELGANLVAQPGHAVLTTPGGVPFCIVPHGGETERAEVIDTERPHAIDQICLDVPHHHFETDVQFWAALTGWPVIPPQLDEYRSFAQPGALPLHILIQQLGPDDTGGPRSHLDISAGDNLVTITERHQQHGAKVIGQESHWTTLTDPAGMAYCLTSRQPAVKAGS